MNQEHELYRKMRLIRRFEERVIELVNANHEVFQGQSKTVTFTIPKGTSHSRSR